VGFVRSAEATQATYGVAVTSAGIH